MTDAQWKPTPGRDAMTRGGLRATEIEHDNVLSNSYVLRGRVGGDCLTWTEDGTYYKGEVPHLLDLVRDADPLPAEPDKPAIPSPVRQRTVTEIVPGVYGRLVVSEGVEPDEVGIQLTDRTCNTRSALQSMNATELRAAASTLTQIADAMEAGE